MGGWPFVNEKIIQTILFVHFYKQPARLSRLAIHLRPAVKWIQVTWKILLIYIYAIKSVAVPLIFYICSSHIEHEVRKFSNEHSMKTISRIASRSWCYYGVCINMHAMWKEQWVFHRSNGLRYVFRGSIHLIDRAYNKIIEILRHHRHSMRLTSNTSKSYLTHILCRVSHSTMNWTNDARWNVVAAPYTCCIIAGIIWDVCDIHI